MRRLVAIGASAGGFRALTEILGELPSSFPASVVIVQHRRPDESSLLGELLGRRTRLPVLEPSHGAPLRPGHVYVAPADYHLLVEPGFLSLSVDGRINSSRPSIDVLFESAATAYGARAVGVVLTGASVDGARGAARLARAGATVLVQDPATAEAATAPAAALERVPGALVLSLTGIAARLLAVCGSAV